jgi:hypothetical protein
VDEAAGTGTLSAFFVSVLEAVVWPQPRTFFTRLALGARRRGALGASVFISWSKGALLTPFLLAFPRSFVCEVVASLGSILSVTTGTIVTISARTLLPVSTRAVGGGSAGAVTAFSPRTCTTLAPRTFAALASGTLGAEGSVSLPIPALEVIPLASEEFVGS